MIIKNIEIKNFRNYTSQKLDFYKGINILYGNNASGKTNLLESIYVLAMTKSHRFFIDNNLIKEGAIYSKIKGDIKVGNIKTNLEIIINDKSKKLKIDNNEIKKVSEYISKMNIIIFYPEDLEIIKSSPIIRRNYINLELSQLESNYYKLISDYNKLLKIRNDYLKKMQKNISVDINYFNIITEYLINKACLIYIMRNKFINKINLYVSDIYINISKISDFKVIYKPSLEINIYEKEEIKKTLVNKYKEIQNSEIKIGSTIIGPHKDDLEFYIGNRNLKNYGSQGQQRLAVLAMKLSEIEIFKSYKNTKPILLLDDVFSELDDKKINKLLKYIGNNIQTIITTTDLNKVSKKLIKKSKKIKIDDGQVIKIEEVEENE